MDTNKREKKRKNVKLNKRGMRRRTERSKEDVLYLDDLLMEILKRLDAKTLLRFRSVSKVWNYIIRHPFFVNLHHNFSKHRAMIVCSFLSPPPHFVRSRSQRRESELCVYTISDQGRVKRYLTINALDIGFKRIDEVSDMVNGLVCINDYNHVAVCNISTHEVISLPRSRKNIYTLTHQNQNQNQNPGTEVTKGTDLLLYYSLGFDPFTKEYKIIGIWVNMATKFICCELFTLGTSKDWKTIDDVPANIEAIQTKSIYIRSSLYWLGTQLVKFDFQNEKFRTIEVPEPISNFARRNLGWGVLYYPIQVEGCFAIKSLDYIYILDEENEVWTRKDFDTGVIRPVGSSKTKVFFLGVDKKHTSRLNLLRFDHEGHRTLTTNITRSLDFTLTLLMTPSTAITEHVENIYPLIRT